MSNEHPVAVVTGASRGVGLAIAGRLARLNHHVVLCARSSPALADAESSLRAAGAAVSSFACDITDGDQVRILADHIAREHGRCDVLVNNAGVGSMGRPLHETPVEAWDQVVSTNLRGPFLMLRAFAPGMIASRQGHIINIGSLAGKSPLANGAAYAASKWGLLGMMLSAAEELRQYGVRVSVISPGSIDTTFGGKAEANSSWKLSPDDVADVVESLLHQSGKAFISEVLIRPIKKAGA